MKDTETNIKAFAAMAIAVAVCAAVCIALLIILEHYTLYEISTDDMEDTLFAGDVILVETDKFELQLKDVVIYRVGNKLQCKRIAALPGDVVDFEEDGHLVVNGHILNEDYAKISVGPSYALETPYTLEEETFLVLGDNRADSIDSRAKAIAGIERDAICGKAILRIWPLKYFGRIGGSVE